MTVQLGDAIFYNGYKNTEKIDTVEAVCLATVIGYDEKWVYIEFKENKNGGDYNGTYENGKDAISYGRFRTGVHKSRIIKVIN